MKRLLKFLIAIYLITFSPTLFAPWIADMGDRTYRNPIIYADYSEPDVIRTDDGYWMVASTFTCIPGIPVLHSKDLVINVTVSCRG